MMKYSSIIIIMLLVALPAGATEIETPNQAEYHTGAITGSTLYVGGSGPGNYSTIQQAVDNASDGDTVFVFDDASPYYEHVYVNASLTLLGENKNTTVIDGGDRGDVLTINKTGVTVSGFTIQRNDWYDDGIVLHASNTIIQGNKVYTCGQGVKAYDVNNITVTRNEFFNNYMGVSLYGASGDVVADNTLNGSFVYGIDLAESGGSNVIEGNIIIANTFPAEQSSYFAIRLWDASDTTVARNTMVSLLDTCYVGLDLYRSNGNTIDQNTFVKNGIRLYQSYQNVISETNSVNGKPLVFLKDEVDKTVEDAGQVVLAQCERITVRNLVLSHLDAGVTLFNSTGCIIENSSFSLCRYGIYLENSKENTFSGNTITSCQEGIGTYQGASNLIRNNTIQKSTYYGLILDEASSTVSSNMIQDNPIGIYVAGRWNNLISGNAIENNSLGVYLTGTFHNTIEKNNFFRDTQDASFDTAVRNRWRHNFWEKPCSTPKVIGGILFTWWTYFPSYPGHGIVVPWLNIDWHPAQTPYDISVSSSK